MSEASVLSSEYRATSELSKEVSRAVLELKKSRGVAEVSGLSTSARKARKYLNGLLVATSVALQGEKPATEKGDPIPRSVVSKLKLDEGGQLSYFIEDLRRAAGRLVSNGDLDDKDFAVIDRFAGALDAEASRVFRRLMRR